MLCLIFIGLGTSVHDNKTIRIHHECEGGIEKGLGSRRGEIGPAIEMHTDLKYVYMVYFIEKKSKFYLPSA